MLTSATFAPTLAGEVDRRGTVRIGLTDWSAHVMAPSDQVPAAHHRLLLAELEALAFGRIDRLMVLMPPGAGKST